MKILVTGSEGYIGRKIVKKLSSDHNVFGIDIKSGLDVRTCLHPSGSLFDKYLNIGFDAIIHTAATPRIQYSIRNPLETLENNVVSCSTALNFCRLSGCKRFVFSSSSSVKSFMNSPYSMQKKHSEDECQMYRDLYGIKTFCLRYFNVYSEFEEYLSHGTLLSVWMNSFKNGKILEIHGDGLQKRDMVHIDDVVLANTIFATEKIIDAEIIQEIGTGSNISILDVYNMFKAHGAKSKYVESRLNDVRESIANPSYFEATTSIDCGVREVLENFFKGLR